MTLNEIFSEVEVRAPHNYPQSTLIMWVNLLEKNIQRFLDGFSDTTSEYEPHESASEEICVDEPELYIAWVEMNVDFANMETDRYNNRLAMFESLYEDWKCEYVNKHPRNAQTAVLL